MNKKKTEDFYYEVKSRPSFDIALEYSEKEVENLLANYITIKGNSLIAPDSPLLLSVYDLDVVYKDYLDEEEQILFNYLSKGFSVSEIAKAEEKNKRRVYRKKSKLLSKITNYLNQT